MSNCLGVFGGKELSRDSPAAAGHTQIFLDNVEVFSDDEVFKTTQENMALPFRGLAI